MAYGFVELNPGSGGSKVFADIIGGFEWQGIKLFTGGEGVAVEVGAGNPLPVTGFVGITGTVDVSGSLVDVSGSTVIVAGTVAVSALPSLPAGGNNIGDVDVLTLPALGQLPAALVGGRLDVTLGTAIPAGTNNIGDVDVLTLPGAALDSPVTGNPVQTRASAAVPTAVSTDGDSVWSWHDRNGRLTTKQSSDSSSVTSVADSATNVTLLAANTARLGATIWNSSTAVLFVKLGATASASSFTVQLIPGAYYEVPFGYRGIIDGIWASDPGTGAAVITELT